MSNICTKASCCCLFVLIALLYALQPTVYSEASEFLAPAEEALVVRWCFETGIRPTDDTAPSGQVKDHLQMKGPIQFEDGIAKFPGQPQDAALFAAPSADLAQAGPMTLWVRLMVNEQPEQERHLPIPIVYSDSYRMFLQTKGKQVFRIGVGGEMTLDGSFADLPTRPTPVKELPAGVWLQAAMVIRREPAGRLAAWWFYRSEQTNSTNNPWIFVGRSRSFEDLPDPQKPWMIGNWPGTDHATGELWIDELRIYDRALTMDELEDCWPVLKDYPKVPRQVPGVVIDHSPKHTGRFFPSSPTLLPLPDGTLLAKGDDYGPARGAGIIGRIYRSTDQGNTWNPISIVENITWATLFLHRGDVYLMGTTAGHHQGYCVIRKSTDQGRSWSEPLDEHTGRLFLDLSYHTAPVPVVLHEGRLWRAMEDEQGPGDWGEMFRAFMLSAPEDANLLEASSWTASDRLQYHPEWLNGKFRGWLEGNVAVTPSGQIVNLLRVSSRPKGSTAAVITYSKDGKKSTFDPEQDFIPMPGGSKKFFIQFDSITQKYWALSNPVLAKHSGSGCQCDLVRNALALSYSDDLRHWRLCNLVLYHPDVVHHAFQYPQFVIQDEDILFVSRTAYNDGRGGAYRQHDANYFTFHRIERFRDMLDKTTNE